jgi:hypothetical protein
MPRAVRLLIALALVALLAGCPGMTRPDLPKAGAVVPKPVVIERRVYVPIDPQLTAPEPVAEGPVHEMPEVSAQRKAALLRANAKLRAIAAKQGTEVPTSEAAP